MNQHEGFVTDDLGDGRYRLALRIDGRTVAINYMPANQAETKLLADAFRTRASIVVEVRGGVLLTNIRADWPVTNETGQFVAK